MKHLQETNQLAIAECRAAIDKWAEIRGQYTEIKKYVDPQNVFCFGKNDLEWMKSFREKDYFYLFTGIYNEKMIFIVTPVDALGNVKRLDTYLYLNPAHLDEDLNLVEKVNVRKVTTLTRNYILLNNTYQTNNLLYENDPSISEESVITRLQSWLEQSLDWFFHESNEFAGQRIFKTFKVPLIDLELNANIDRVYCLFGLKETLIYNMLVPVVNFIAVDAASNQLKLDICGSEIDNGNIGDFSSPCPPFCRDKGTFPQVQ